MTQANAYSITIRVPTGRPERLRIIEKPGWSVIGFMFPYDDFRQEHVRQQKEIGNAGVYILWGDDDDGKQKVYIGQGDDLFERLGTHASSKGNSFWNETIVFTSKDKSVTKTHVLFVESELVRIAKLVDPSKVANGQDPGKPNMSEIEMDIARRFLNDSLSCMEILGVPFFNETRTSSLSSDIESPEESAGLIAPQPDLVRLFLSGGQGRREANGTGYRNGKELVVLAGARAAREEAPSASVQIRHEPVHSGR